MKERPIIFSSPLVRELLAGTKTQTRRVMKPQPPSAAAVRSLAGDTYHLNGSEGGMWRVMGPVWAVRQLMNERPVDARFNANVGPQWRCPYGASGDRLWVKEEFAFSVKDPDAFNESFDEDHYDGVYRATSGDTGEWINTNTEGTQTRITAPWRSPLFMPRWASRITLEVTEVRVQRLQDISEADARAEGVEPLFARFPLFGRDQRITSGELARDAEHRASYAVLWDEINGDRALWISNPWVWAVTFRRVP